jgi:hypothetical protein
MLGSLSKTGSGGITAILVVMAGLARIGLLTEILEQQNRNLKWKAGGASPETGFDSPRFAAWLLERSGVIGKDQFAALTSQDTLGAQHGLITKFPVLPNITPSDGDLVFYRSGYTMFYFKDFGRLQNIGDPNLIPGFVAGMTPFGIAGLDPKFADQIGVAHIAYPRAGCM